MRMSELLPNSDRFAYRENETIHSTSVRSGDCVSISWTTNAQDARGVPGVAVLHESLRLARLQLGASIDRLETVDLSPPVLMELWYGAGSVAKEIESLMRIIRQLVDPPSNECLC